MLKLLTICLLFPLITYSQDLYSTMSLTYVWNGKRPEIIDMSKSVTYFRFHKDYIYINGETKNLCYIVSKYQTDSLMIDAFDCLDDDERRFFISKSFDNSTITIVHGYLITKYYNVIPLKSDEKFRYTRFF